jgi:YVTN family beta-propeller protein
MLFRMDRCIFPKLLIELPLSLLFWEFAVSTSHRARGVLVTTLTTALTLASFAGLTLTAHADTTSGALSLNGYHQMAGGLGSAGDGYLYISEGTGDGIAVVTASDTLQATVLGSDVIEGITQDSGYVFAADATADAIQVIDPATYSVIATWPLPTGDTPYSVVEAWNDLYVSYDDGSAAPDGAIGDFAIPGSITSGTSSTFVPDAVPGTYSWTSAPDLSSDSGSGTLVASDEGNSPETAAVYQAGDPSATTVIPPTATNISDGAGSSVLPVGRQFAFVGSSPDSVSIYNLDDSDSFSEPFVLPVTGSPNSVAASSVNDGEVAVGTAQDVYIYSPAGDLDNVIPVSGLVSQGLAWDDSDGSLYAVTDNNGSYALDTLDTPYTTTTSLTITGTSTATVGTTVSLTGQLNYASGVGVADATLNVSIKAPNGTTTRATYTTNSTGGFTIFNVPSTTGTYTYTANYGGVQNWDGSYFETSTGSATVTARLTAAYTPVAPVRVLDTRNGTGGYSSPVGAGKSISLQVTGQDGVPATGVSAVVLNLTATGSTANGWVVAYPDGTTRPAEGSNLNFTKGETIPNLVTVPVGSDGKVDLYNSVGSVNLVADLQGYYSASGESQYAADGPVRVLDTRNGTGGFSSPVGAGKSIALQVTGQDGVPATGVTAVVLNLTATGPTASGWVVAYPDGQPRPAQGSNVNFTKGETIPNLVIVPVGSDGKVDLYNSAGSVNLVADLEGYFAG